MESTLVWLTPVKAVMALAKRAYSGSYLTIAVREGAGQNSPDAGARRCDVIIEPLGCAGDQGQDVTRVTQVDDGRGMTPEVIQNAFLTFGGSWKPEGGAGGFGYAKFAVLDGNVTVGGNEWELWTRPRGSSVCYRVTSSMLGERPIEVLDASLAPPFFPHEHGTAIVVYREGRVEAEEANRVLACTHRPGVRYYVHRPEGVVEVEPLTRATLKAELSFGRVFFKKSCPPFLRGYLVVRTRGSYQFKTFVSSRMDGVAILEIDEKLTPTDTAYPLTPAREQVRDHCRAELEQILEGFQKAERLKDDDPFVVTRYRGRKLARPRREVSAVGVDAGASTVQLRELNTTEMRVQRSMEQALEPPPSLFDDELDELLDDAGAAVAGGPGGDEGPVPLAPTVTMHVQTLEERREAEVEARRREAVEEWAASRAAAAAFARRLDNAVTSASIDGGDVPLECDMPDLIVRRHREVRKSINPFSRRNIRFMAAWHTVLSEVAATLGMRADGFGIGWCLTTDSLAERFVVEGQEFFLLSPAGVSRKDPTALALTLVQRATHELLHRDLGYHDAEFVARLHGHLETLNPHMRRLQKVVRAALIGGRRALSVDAAA